jgi:S-adenosylmethionine:tRNA ribosyltransferase-isomerase
MNFTLSDFDYDLPQELIAQKPAYPRDHARLLVYNRADKSIRDEYFYDLMQFLPPRTTLVVNNSKVEKCRLLFDGGKKEIFVIESTGASTIQAMVRPGKKFKKGKKVQLTPQISAKVLDVDKEGLRTIKLDPPLQNECYHSFRHTPFPPYIKQNDALSEEYQTIYAEYEGSKAAPTAGLHFTPEMWKEIGESDIKRAEVTLHVGLGTFAPVKNAIETHKMHEEWYRIDDETAKLLNNATHITAVGSTSMRVLESNRQRNDSFHPEEHRTDIFIKPGYRFKAVDAVITNFHLPKSTLLMLVAAFMGYDEMMRVYRHAISQRYRFYSFGDAMLIL